MNNKSRTRIAALLFSAALCQIQSLHAQQTHTHDFLNQTGRPVNDLHVEYANPATGGATAPPFAPSNRKGTDHDFMGATIAPGTRVRNQWINNRGADKVMKAYWTLYGTNFPGSDIDLSRQIGLTFRSNPDGTLALVASNGSPTALSYSNLSVVTAADSRYYPYEYLEHMSSGFVIPTQLPGTGMLSTGLTVIASFPPSPTGYSAASLSIGGNVTATGWSLRPHLSGVSLLGGVFQIEVSAVPYHSYVLQASPDLQTWSDFATHFITNEVSVLTGLTVAATGQRFFRLQLTAWGWCYDGPSCTGGLIYNYRVERSACQAVPGGSWMREADGVCFTPP